MSTLSEIAANHAIKANALEAESARASKPSSPVLHLFETPATTEQEVPGAITINLENNENMFRHVTCC